MFWKSVFGERLADTEGAESGARLADLEIPKSTASVKSTRAVTFFKLGITTSCEGTSSVFPRAAKALFGKK
ncbi:MAG: hypothetical protein JWM36_2678 [Hyphomicrobiales bacterium]|nr:hypothetical protein [Hyphomicrobiales bacterium]